MPDRQAVEDAAGAEDSPVSVLFPDYLLLDGIKLNDHGRIPATPLIGADMTATNDLATVRSLFSTQLADHGWNTDKMEIGRQYFRLMASHEDEQVEIRAVQGTGPTQVFLLYQTTPSKGEQ